MPYEVQTPVFEGPFDLLLHLILREQVDLYEISLSRIVDAYLVEIEKMESLDLEITTEFLLIAATLVEVEGLGHAWSGGASGQPFSDASGPDASRMAWAFAAKQFAPATR